MDKWSPMFAVLMGIPRDQLLDLSIPLMVDYIDLWQDTRGPQNG